MILFLMILILVSWSLNSLDIILQSKALFLHKHRVAYEVAASQRLKFEVCSFCHDQLVPLNDSKLRSGGKVDLSKRLSIFMLVDGIHVITS
jgi:hypothetical protein